MTLTLTHTLTAGQPENVTHVQTNFTDVKTWADNAEGSIFSAYRTLLSAQGATNNDIAAATYFLGNSGGLAASPVTLVSAGAPANTSLIPVRYLDDADFTTTGKTTKVRLRAQVSTNATQPAITFTFGLYPVTFAGAADTLTMTAGTVVSSSTVAIASPSASSTTTGTSNDITIPADGLYAIGVVTSAQLTNNAAALLSATLGQRWS